MIKDYTALFKAFVMPYMAICSFTGIVFMLSTGQEVDIILWGLLSFSLGEMGIDWSVRKMAKK